MKTKVKRNIVQIMMFFVLAIFTQGCETEIPPEDPTPPKFSFHIYGDGLDHTFDQDTDFDNIKLNLKKFTTYNFTYIGSDAGGVERVQWEILPSVLVTIPDFPTEPWTFSRSAASKEIRWNGERSNPLTGAILTGRFIAPDLRFQGVFRFSVTDFGGDTRRPNTITKELNISTGNVAHIGVIPL